MLILFRKYTIDIKPAYITDSTLRVILECYLRPTRASLICVTRFPICTRQSCPWPEPLAYSYDYDEEMVWSGRDDETQELLDIKEYFDSLVASGRLNEDYTLNEDYVSPFREFEDSDEDEYPEDFTPEKGEEYWDDGFDIEA